MSEGEYSLFTRQVTEVDEELGQFGEGLGKCGVLFSAGEIAAGSECVEEAYDGVEGDMLGAYATVEDLEGDVAQQCLRALRTYKNRLDIYYGWSKQLRDAGTNLQSDRFAELGKLAGLITQRYHGPKRRALRICAPA